LNKFNLYFDYSPQVERLGKDGMSREEACLDGSVVGDLTASLYKLGLEQRIEKFEIPRSLYLVAEPWTPESGQDGSRCIPPILTPILPRSHHSRLQAQEEGAGERISGRHRRDVRGK
jgi:hypothetical protein